MIDAWDIYWVMQLDSIGASLGFLSIGGLVACVVLVVLGAINKSISSSYPELTTSKRERASGEAQHNIAKKLAPIVSAVFLINAFIPSTKTAAAMIVAPAIVNNEAIQREAGDLYVLAKQALAEAVKPDKPKSDE